ncbi:hypothetical protein D9M72_261090 [compost metagenome]
MSTLPRMVPVFSTTACRFALIAVSASIRPALRIVVMDWAYASTPVPERPFALTLAPLSTAMSTVAALSPVAAPQLTAAMAGEFAPCVLTAPFAARWTDTGPPAALADVWPSFM